MKNTLSTLIRLVAMFVAVLFISFICLPLMPLFYFVGLIIRKNDRKYQ